MVSLFYILFQIVLVFPLLYISQYMWKWYTPFNDQQLMVENKYSASGLLYFSYILSLAIMSSLAFYGESHIILLDTMSIITVYIYSNILLITTLFLVNKSAEFLFKKEKNYFYSLIEKQNSAVAFFYGFILLSIAIQYLVSNYGKLFDIITFFSISLPYFMFGQLLIVLSLFFLKFKTKYDDIKEIEKNNVSVALYYGSILITSSLLIGNVIHQVEMFTLYDVGLVFIYSFLSIMFLIIFPELVLKVLFGKKVNVEELIVQDNINIALSLFATRIVFAVIVYFSMSFNLV